MQGAPASFFRNPPSPLPKGAPPLPVSPLLRRGEKEKVAAATTFSGFGKVHKAFALRVNLDFLSAGAWNGSGRISRDGGLRIRYFRKVKFMLHVTKSVSGKSTNFAA